MRSERAWVRMEPGRRLNLLQPNPDSWTDRDLAIGLSRTYRWGGHSCWDLPLSVTQHSLLVLVLRQKSAPLDRLTRGEALRELLHDADEGMLSFDPISPLKPHLGADYDSLVSRLRTAIEARYIIPAWDDVSYAAHKHADGLAAASEAVHIAGWSDRDVQDTLGIQTRPLIRDPLPQLAGLKPWEPWPARTAAALFLTKLRELTGSEHLEHAADLDACIAREKIVAELAIAFSRLPPIRRLRRGRPSTGNSLRDTFVLVEAGDHSASIKGVIVDGDRDGEGGWDFDVPFYQRAESKDALALLRLSVTPDNPQGDEAFRRVINVPPRGYGPKAMDAAEQEAAWRQVSLLQALETAELPPKARGAGLAFADAIRGVARDRAATVADQISLLLDATGYRAMLHESKAETTEDKLENIQELIGLAGDCHTARELLNHAALPTSGPQDESADRVRLMTMHKGKGLEFPHVFLPPWEGGTFPPDYGDISEERRLGYVAITRAMRRVTITHCDFRRGYTLPSSFIEDLPGPNRVKGWLRGSTGSPDGIHPASRSNRTSTLVLEHQNRTMGG